MPRFKKVKTFLIVFWTGVLLAGSNFLSVGIAQATGSWFGRAPSPRVAGSTTKQMQTSAPLKASQEVKKTLVLKQVSSPYVSPQATFIDNNQGLHVAAHEIKVGIANQSTMIVKFGNEVLAEKGLSFLEDGDDIKITTPEITIPKETLRRLGISVEPDGVSFAFPAGRTFEVGGTSFIDPGSFMGSFMSYLAGFHHVQLPEE